MRRLLTHHRLHRQQQHHCRRCGKVYCGECSDHTIVVPALVQHYGREPVRVCDPCFNQVAHESGGAAAVAGAGVPSALKAASNAASTRPPQRSTAPPGTVPPVTRAPAGAAGRGAAPAPAATGSGVAAGRGTAAAGAGGGTATTAAPPQAEIDRVYTSYSAGASRGRGQRPAQPRPTQTTVKKAQAPTPIRSGRDLFITQTLQAPAPLRKSGSPPVAADDEQAAPSAAASNGDHSAATATAAAVVAAAASPAAAVPAASPSPPSANSPNKPLNVSSGSSSRLLPKTRVNAKFPGRATEVENSIFEVAAATPPPAAAAANRSTIPRVPSAPSFSSPTTNSPALSVADNIFSSPSTLPQLASMDRKPSLNLFDEPTYIGGNMGNPPPARVRQAQEKVAAASAAGAASSTVFDNGPIKVAPTTKIDLQVSSDPIIKSATHDRAASWSAAPEIDDWISVGTKQPPFNSANNNNNNLVVGAVTAVQPVVQPVVQPEVVKTQAPAPVVKPAAPQVAPKAQPIAVPVAAPAPVAVVDEFAGFQPLHQLPLEDYQAIPPRVAGTIDPAQVVKMQSKAFVRWLNYWLSVRQFSIPDVFQGLSDGVALVLLAEIITGTPISEEFVLYPAPETSVQKAQNIDAAVAHFRTMGKPLPYISVTGTAIFFKSTPIQLFSFQRVISLSLRSRPSSPSRHHLPIPPRSIADHLTVSGFL